MPVSFHIPNPLSFIKKRMQAVFDSTLRATENLRFRKLPWRALLMLEWLRLFSKDAHILRGCKLTMKRPIRPPPFLESTTMDAQVVPAWEYHVHSHFSDGSAPMATLIGQARDLGITRLIFTEHTEPGLVGGEGWFNRYWQEANRLRALEKSGMEIVIGLEVPISDYSGGLVLDAEMAEKAEFILGAVHAYPGHGWDLEALSAEQAIEMEFKGLMALAENAQVDAIAHPGGVCHKYATPFPFPLFEEVVRKATGNGIAIELNPAYQEPLAPYLEICRRHHALISPGSNAHHPEEIGRAWEELCLLHVGRGVLKAVVS